MLLALREKNMEKAQAEVKQNPSRQDDAHKKSVNKMMLNMHYQSIVEVTHAESKLL